MNSNLRADTGGRGWRQSIVPAPGRCARSQGREGKGREAGLLARVTDGTHLPTVTWIKHWRLNRAEASRCLPGDKASLSLFKIRV